MLWPRARVDSAWQLLAAAALVSVSLVACQAHRPGRDAAEPVYPGTPAGERLQWAVEASRGTPLSDLESVFAPGFLSVMPPEKLIEFFDSLAPETGGLDLVALETNLFTEVVTTARARTDAQWWRVSLAVEPGPPHRIVRILFQPADDLNAPDLPNWEALDAILAEFRGKTSLAVWRVQREGELDPVHRFRSGESLAIGSAFKLWVLGAVGELVRSGDASWDEPLRIEDRWKSALSGQLQDVPAGETRSLRELARLMISISDNTAADHLIHRVGRETVEAFMARHTASAARNLPFLTTRELIQLKIAAPESLRQQYAAASHEKRRLLLAEAVNLLELPQGGGCPDTPTEIDRIEWFSSADELCRLMVVLDGLARNAAGEPVRAALIENDGLRWDRARWPTVAFKGGAEPGVLNLTWLLSRSDGQIFAVSMGWNDRQGGIDRDRAQDAAYSMAKLLGRER